MIVKENTLNRVVLETPGIDLTDLQKDIQIKYKTQATEKPCLLYETNEEKYPGKVAVMAQFLPQFLAPVVEPQEKVEMTADEDGLEEDDVDPKLED